MPAATTAHRFSVVLPNGVEVTRNSKGRVFTHCWIFRYTGEGYESATEWAVGGWSSSEALAESAIPGYARRNGETKVLPVTTV